MCILSDKDINLLAHKYPNLISDYSNRNLQPASYDVSLHKDIRVFKSPSYTVVNPYLKNNILSDVIDISNPKEAVNFTISPGEFILASTNEVFDIPHDIVARVEGKSSLGRYGLLVHSTAGYVDPGFSGSITLELANVGKYPIVLTAGMPIAQVSFVRMSSKASNPYGSKNLNSKYQGQSGPTESRYSQNIQIPKEPEWEGC